MAGEPDIASAHEAPQIVVAGAGAIGCFVGGLLRAAGHHVTLLLRHNTASELRAHGLTLTDFSGLALTVKGDELKLSEEPAVLATADIVLVTVKSPATAEMGALIARHAPRPIPVISLQNGIENVTTLRRLLPEHDLRAGMVPFNVVPMGQGVFHRATSGDIVIGQGGTPLGSTLSVPHLTLTESAEITAIQWGKFLINLANALNALSGLTLKQMLRDAAWRRLMADQWAEALKVLRARGLRPASTTPLPVGLIPHVLRLPTPLFTRLAAQMLTIDAQARSSMAHDLMRGRPTEIDALQGQVMRMGAELGRATPLNARVYEVVKLAELAAEGLPHLPARALRSKTL
ncbi:MAG: 2-dehydropantoate 2-reductase [Pseudomonadota bacterium]